MWEINITISQNRRHGQAQRCLTLHGAPCHAAQMKAQHSADGLIRLQQWACSFDACLPSLYLGREAH
ncbi:tRNA pseudouridine synthase A [Dissostichus eleginoides]|uniref:tRNA pseudouridine synthase A n=1 Tax=Dissostichus eleginoides TaxID=100907 RepID=A0AAD9C2X2_DISEL|nr:tRNA pseudouridine synthase A [Dissostichus eleginoides]